MATAHSGRLAGSHEDNDLTFDLSHLGAAQLVRPDLELVVHRIHGRRRSNACAA
jgi:hypothetical protein